MQQKTSRLNPQSALMAAAIAVTLAACTTTASVVKPGDLPGKVPPKLTFVSYWDDPAAFGKVPPELKATGDKNCQAIGAIEAIGYHPKAEDAQGKPIPGGGYFCRFPTLEEAEAQQKAKQGAASAK